MAAGAVRAINSRSGKELSGNMSIACNEWHRLKGLLGQKSLSRDEGLLIRPCRCVHTFGMKFPIDLLFLNKDNTVIAAIAVVPPNHLSPIYLGAYSVLELAAGRIAETATMPGDLIVFEKICLAQAALSGPKVAAPALSPAIKKHRGHSRKLKSPLSLEARQLLRPAACSLCLHLLLVGAVAAGWQPEPDVVWVSLSTFSGVEQVQVDSLTEPSDLSAASEAGDAEGGARTEEADEQQREPAHQIDHGSSPETGGHPVQPEPPSETVAMVDLAGAGKSPEVSSTLIAPHEPADIAETAPPLPLARYSSASVVGKPRHVTVASETVPVPPPSAPVLAQLPRPQALTNAGRQLQFLVGPDKVMEPSASPSSRAEQKPPEVIPVLPASTADDAQKPNTSAVSRKLLSLDNPSRLHQGADPKSAVATAREQVIVNPQRSGSMGGLPKPAAISRQLPEGSAVSFQRAAVTGSQELAPPRHAARYVSQEGASPAVALQHQPVEVPAASRPLALPAWVKPPAEKVAESRSITVLPEPVFQAPVRGDLELYMTGKGMGANETRIVVLFRPYPRERHKRPMSQKESKKSKTLSPTIKRTGNDTVQAVIEIAPDGVYEFRAEPDAQPQEADCAVTIHGTGSRPIKRELGTRKVGNGSNILKVLMPEGILWEDDSSFTGTIKDSDGIIKFSSETGLTWKEYN